VRPFTQPKLGEERKDSNSSGRRFTDPDLTGSKEKGRERESTIFFTLRDRVGTENPADLPHLGSKGGRKKETLPLSTLKQQGGPSHAHPRGTGKKKKGEKNEIPPLSLPPLRKGGKSGRPVNSPCKVGKRGGIFFYCRREERGGLRRTSGCSPPGKEKRKGDPQWLRVTGKRKE